MTALLLLPFLTCGKRSNSTPVSYIKVSNGITPVSVNLMGKPCFPLLLLYTCMQQQSYNSDTDKESGAFIGIDVGFGLTTD